MCKIQIVEIKEAAENGETARESPRMRKRHENDGFMGVCGRTARIILA
jgi:hypothetical protein